MSGCVGITPGEMLLQASASEGKSRNVYIMPAARRLPAEDSHAITRAGLAFAGPRASVQLFLGARRGRWRSRSRVGIVGRGYQAALRMSRGIIHGGRKGCHPHRWPGGSKWFESPRRRQIKHKDPTLLPPSVGHPQNHDPNLGHPARRLPAEDSHAITRAGLAFAGPGGDDYGPKLVRRRGKRGLPSASRYDLVRRVWGHVTDELWASIAGKKPKPARKPLPPAVWPNRLSTRVQ